METKRTSTRFIILIAILVVLSLGIGLGVGRQLVKENCLKENTKCVEDPTTDNKADTKDEEIKSYLVQSGNTYNGYKIEYENTRKDDMSNFRILVDGKEIFNKSTEPDVYINHFYIIGDILMLWHAWSDGSSKVEFIDIEGNEIKTTWDKNFVIIGGETDKIVVDGANIYLSYRLYWTTCDNDMVGNNDVMFKTVLIKYLGNNKLSEPQVLTSIKKSDYC